MSEPTLESAQVMMVSAPPTQGAQAQQVYVSETASQKDNGERGPRPRRRYSPRGNGAATPGRVADACRGAGGAASGACQWADASRVATTCPPQRQARAPTGRQAAGGRRRGPARRVAWGVCVSLAFGRRGTGCVPAPQGVGWGAAVCWACHTPRTPVVLVHARVGCDPVDEDGAVVRLVRDDQGIDIRVLLVTPQRVNTHQPRVPCAKRCASEAHLDVFHPRVAGALVVPGAQVGQAVDLDPPRGGGLLLTGGLPPRLALSAGLAVPGRRRGRRPRGVAHGGNTHCNAR